MFAYLRGTVAAKAAGHIELDVGGVGYAVSVPDTVHRRLMLERPVKLLTYCHIREDTFQIFGFLRPEERTLFLMLLSVSGIGPKVALAILSGLSPSEFGRAITDSDVSAFTKIGGVGKKTAQRIILDMKAKLGQDAELDAILGEHSATDDLEEDDAIAALVSLGCSVQEAKVATTFARDRLDDGAPDEEVVREALRSLAKV